MYFGARDFKLQGGRITAFPVKEEQQLLTDSDEAPIRIKDGFIINSQNHDPVVYKGEIKI